LHKVSDERAATDMALQIRGTGILPANLLEHFPESNLRMTS
jgi:hypothetical protein